MRGFLLMFLLGLPWLRADSILQCGGPRVFEVDSADGRVTWEWDATKEPTVPEDLRAAFATTDECKPVEGGKRCLITASSGGCAMIDRASGKVLWSARVRNAHSIELLPGNRIIVASSLGGDELLLFDVRSGDRVWWKTPLKSAHGVVWDGETQRLHALGYDVLRTYRLADSWTEHPALVEMKSHDLPDHDGHDLMAVPGSRDLVLSTESHVWLFDREQAVFRPHPDLHAMESVKGISIHPKTGRIVIVQASQGRWWSESARLLNPPGKLDFPGEKIYKARWAE
ncbi:MAG: PQQ-like beta-propeller repeat protein [Akkermansiaceae bacterium]|jgi:hypothetical protein|nr:PQQ-like beta-propeller repeat protein [Akkermansiaceae bacterium]